MAYKFSPQEKPRKFTNKFPKELKPGYYNAKPAFSFRYFDLKHGRFGVHKISQQCDWEELIEKLKVICDHHWREIATEKRRFFRFHDINWHKTTSEKGFKHAKDLWEKFPAVQIKTFKECRLIGYINADNVFEVIWFDRDHELHPDDRF